MHVQMTTHACSSWMPCAARRSMGAQAGKALTHAASTTEVLYPESHQTSQYERSGWTARCCRTATGC